MNFRRTLITGSSLVAALAFATPAFAHCDTLDGPVVSAARKALDTGNVNFVLVWVQKGDEADIRKAFERTRTVRRSGGEARELADAHFYETLVRIHRAGEGAPYTGLKAGGHDEPSVAAADRAIETGKLQALAKLTMERMEKGLHSHYDAAMATKKYTPDDVDAGRAYVGAYVEFVHYAERLYDAAGAQTPEHAHTPATAHAH